MLFGTLAIILASLAIGDTQNVESKIVTIAQGTVRGYRAQNSNVFEFFGIPYATAPTGVNRFKAPLPAPTWNDTLEATDRLIVCPQNRIDIIVTEDCLVANVFVPDTQETNLPVLVYIHGGAYLFGSSTGISPNPLVESQKIVAVKLNYRLGPHGFLCLGTEDIPGNAGLKDMVAGLHWVRNNIENFGGNPNDVTLAGYSAGSSAVEHLSLSKAAEGLFNKIILEAGTVSGWGVQTDPINTAQDYARKLNFNNVENLDALEEFYKTISYEVLLSEVSQNNYNSDFVFVPCVEKDLGQQRILEDSPVNVIKNSEYRKVPVLVGFTNMEGMFRMPLFDEWAPKMNANFSDFLVPELEFENDNEKESVSHAVKEFYFGSNAVGLYTLFKYIDYFGDVMFAYPILRSIKLRVEAGDDQIYLFEYSFYKRYNPIPGVPDILVNFPGANHGAQTEAIFEAAWILDNDNFTEEYRQIRVQMRELWVNFVTTGTPVPEGSSFPPWPPTNASGSPHMILGDTFELGGPINENRVKFWDDIYDRHYRHPIPPVFVESEEVPDSARILSGSIILNLLLIYVIHVCI